MTNSEYSAVHKWVKNKLGKPSICENCVNGYSNVFQWANLSGEYRKDVSDWARLCGRCHTLVDGRHGSTHYNSKDTCKKGHLLSGDNLYIKRQNSRGHIINTRICRTCDRNYVRNYYWRNKGKEQPND